MDLSWVCLRELMELHREHGKIAKKNSQRSCYKIMEETVIREVKPRLRSWLLYEHDAQVKMEKKKRKHSKIDGCVQD